MQLSVGGLRRISGWLDATGRFLDSLFGLAGRAGILFAVGIVIYAVVQLFFSADEPSETRSGKLLVLLNSNWKAALLVLLPVFYLPLRALINSIREITIAGTTIRTSGNPSELDSEEDTSRY